MPLTMMLLPFSQAMSGAGAPGASQVNVTVSPTASLTALGVTNGTPEERKLWQLHKAHTFVIQEIAHTKKINSVGF